MRLVLIADAYPPLRSSASVQLRDLSIEFARHGHDLTVIVSAPEINVPWKIERLNGIQIVRLKCLKTKDILEDKNIGFKLVSLLRRTVGELLMPFLMLHNLRKTPLSTQKWDGIIWYSPTIFLGPMVSALKVLSNCRSYLILRDIFPEWAVDLGLMGRGLPYCFFKVIAKYQYSLADVIGIQTPGNLTFFDKRLKQQSSGQIEVLHNWLADAPVKVCSISVSKTILSGRKIFVYAGNMGVCQGMGILLDLAEQLRSRVDIGFLFVGRGSEAQKLRKGAEHRELDNTVFFKEIEPEEIPGLYAQCDVGLLTLDPRHKTHNIPGKFLSYMRAGLPVLASVNQGNDIVDIFASEKIGLVCTDASDNTLKVLAEQLVDEITQDAAGYATRCKALSEKLFAPDVAVRQIIAALNYKGEGKK